jgi:3-hydroxyacyl-[acyl-carrier-protein] dehydratase
LSKSVTSLLRQRPPFLFIDDYQPLPNQAGIEASFHFSGEEAYFAGHFPDEPVVPGVLLIEAMAQAGRIALAHRFERALPGYLATVERARFTAPVRPPEQIRLVAKLKPEENLASGFVVVTCSAFIGETRAARADLTLSVRTD